MRRGMAFRRDSLAPSQYQRYMKHEVIVIDPCRQVQIDVFKDFTQDSTDLYVEIDGQRADFIEGIRNFDMDHYDEVTNDLVCDLKRVVGRRPWIRILSQRLGLCQETQRRKRRQTRPTVETPLPPPIRSPSRSPVRPRQPFAPITDRNTFEDDMPSDLLNLLSGTFK